MRYQGHNVLAIFVAAILMYGIGALIYGVALSQVWQEAVGFNEADYAGLEYRFALSFIPPLLLAAGISMANKWRGAIGPLGGVVTGLLVAFFFLLAARFYQFAYSPESEIVFAIDVLHFVSIGAVGGAVIGAWK